MNDTKYLPLYYNAHVKTFSKYRVHDKFTALKHSIQEKWPSFKKTAAKVAQILFGVTCFICYFALFLLVVFGIIYTFMPAKDIDDWDDEEYSTDGSFIENSTALVRNSTAKTHVAHAPNFIMIHSPNSINTGNTDIKVNKDIKVSKIKNRPAGRARSRGGGRSRGARRGARGRGGRGGGGGRGGRGWLIKWKHET